MNYKVKVEKSDTLSMTSDNMEMEKWNEVGTGSWEGGAVRDHMLVCKVVMGNERMLGLGGAQLLGLE